MSIEINGQVFKLAGVSIDLSRQVLSKVAAGYRAYFEARKNGDTEVRKPGPMNTEWFQTLSWSAQHIRVEKGVLQVPGFSGEDRLAIPLGGISEPRGDNRSREIGYLGRNLSDKVRYATLTYDWRGKQFYLSLVVGLSPTPFKVETPTFYRAIDLGAGDYAVTDSDGTEFLIPARRPDKWHQPEIKKLDRRIKRNKLRKSRRVARRVRFAKQSNQFLSFQRKLADALVEDKVHCVVVGRSKIRLGLSQSEDGSPKQHYGVQNTGNLSRLARLIKQKCQERGVRFIELQDPKREGSLEDPESKLRASRKLIAETLKGTSIPMPTKFIRKGFSYTI